MTTVYIKKKKRMMLQIAIEYRGFVSNNQFEDYVNNQWKIMRETQPRGTNTRDVILSRGSINHMINCDSERSMSVWIFVSECLKFPVKEIHEAYQPPDNFGLGQWWVGEEGGRIQDCNALADKSSTIAKLVINRDI